MEDAASPVCVRPLSAFAPQETLEYPRLKYYFFGIRYSRHSLHPYHYSLCHRFCWAHPGIISPDKYVCIPFSPFFFLIFSQKVLATMTQARFMGVYLLDLLGVRLDICLFVNRLDLASSVQSLLPFPPLLLPLSSYVDRRAHSLLRKPKNYIGGSNYRFPTSTVVRIRSSEDLGTT